MSGARERICEAMLELVYSQGYDATEIDEVVERAGASRAEFDRLFASKEECALAVFDHFMGDFEAKIGAAYETEEQWPASLRAVAYAVADWMTENPRGMRFGTVEMLWVSELAQARREAGFQTFVGMVDAGRTRAADPDSIPPFTAEGVIGATAEILTKRLQRGELDPYALAPELMYLAVLPYMGEDAARAELAMPAPRRRSMATVAGYRQGVPQRKPGAGEPEQPPSRLPRGRHGLPRAMVVENQRERLIAGIIEAVAEHGYNETTIATIIKAAGLSRRTFYEHFANKEDCFEAAYGATLSYLREATLGAAAGPEGWSERIHAGLSGLLTSLAADPDLARLFLIAPASVGDQAVDRHHRAMRELVGELIAGPPEPPSSLEPSEAREQALAGGISRLTVRKINAGEEERLPDLLPSLLELVLTPYLGGEEAVRVAGEG